MKKIITIVFLALFVASCSTKQDKISTWIVQNSSTWITQTWAVSTEKEDKTILYDKNLKEMQTNKKLWCCSLYEDNKMTNWNIFRDKKSSYYFSKFYLISKKRLL